MAVRDLDKDLKALNLPTPKRDLLADMQSLGLAAEVDTAPVQQPIPQQVPQTVDPYWMPDNRGYLEKTADFVNEAGLKSPVPEVPISSLLKIALDQNLKPEPYSEDSSSVVNTINFLTNQTSRLARFAPEMLAHGVEQPGSLITGIPDFLGQSAKMAYDAIPDLESIKGTKKGKEELAQGSILSQPPEQTFVPASTLSQPPINLQRQEATIGEHPNRKDMKQEATIGASPNETVDIDREQALKALYEGGVADLSLLLLGGRGFGVKDVLRGAEKTPKVALNPERVQKPKPNKKSALELNVQNGAEKVQDTQIKPPLAPEKTVKPPDSPPVSSPPVEPVKPAVDKPVEPVSTGKQPKADPLVKEAKKYKSAEEFVNSNKVKTIGSAGGAQRSFFKQKVNLQDLELHDSNLKIAEDAFKKDPNFKVSNKPVQIGIDIETGKMTLFDGYHRYVKKGGEGLVDALVMPMKNGETLNLTDLWNKANLGGESGKVTPSKAEPLKPSKDIKQAPPVLKDKPVSVNKTEISTTKDNKIDVEKSKEADYTQHIKKRKVDDYALTIEDAQIIKERIGSEASLGQVIDMVEQRKRSLKLDDKILDIADDIRRTGRPHETPEVIALNRAQNKLAKDYDVLTAEMDKLSKSGKDPTAVRVKRDQIQADLEKVLQASRMGGGSTGQALSVRQQQLPIQRRPVAEILSEAKTIKGKRLTEWEEIKVKEQRKDIDKAVRIEEKVSQSDLAKIEELAQKRAEEIVARQKKTKNIQKERDVIADAKKELQKLGFRVNDITGITAEGLHQVGRIAVAYAKLTGKSLADVVASVKKDIPDLSEIDIYQAINTKDPAYIKKTVSEKVKNVREVKKHAKKMVEIDSALKTVFDAEQKGLKVDPKIIDNLQQQWRDIRNGLENSGLDAKKLENAINKVNELQDQIYELYRPVRGRKKPTAPELKELKDKQSELRKILNAQDRLAELERQIRTKDFPVKKEIINEPMSKELLRAKIDVMNAEKALKETLRGLEPWRPRRIAREAANTVRTLKATADFSYALRQGFVLSARRPKLAAKVFGEAFRATFSKRRADEIDVTLRSTKEYLIGQQHGLNLTDIGAKLSTGEELFMSSLLDKIPGYGKIVQASERNMVTGLNLMRQGVFNEFLRKFPEATSVELKAWADWVNVATGRGNVGRYGEVLSQVFFAPRFAASRVQTPFMVFKHWKNPRVRNEIAKDMAAVGSLAITTIAMAKMAGLEVGDDPRASDWGKIRYKDTRFDMFAGMQQPMRVLARIGFSVSDEVGWSGANLTDKEKDVDLYELIGRFAMYKTAPVISLPIELARGKDVIGQERTRPETLLNAIKPLVLQTVLEAYKNDGAKTAGVAGGLEFLGVGVSTYPDSEGYVRRKIRDLKAEGAYAMAEETQKIWNEKNPNNRIVNEEPVPRKKFDSKLKQIKEDYFVSGDKTKARAEILKLRNKYPDYKSDLPEVMDIQSYLDKYVLDRKVNINKSNDKIKEGYNKLREGR